MIVLSKRIFLLVLAFMLHWGIAPQTIANPKPAQKKSSPAKKSPTTPTRLGASSHYKNQNWRPYTAPNSLEENNTIVNLGSPLPTPNIIENILQTPSPDIVKSSSNQGFSYRHNCEKTTRSMSEFLKNISIQDQEFIDAFNRQVPGFFNDLQSVCLPYALSIDSQGKIQAFSILNNESRNPQTTLVTLHRSTNAGGFITDSIQLGNGFENYLEVTMDLNDLLVYKANQASTSIPPELIWELASLVKELYSKISPNVNHYARIVYDAGSKNKWAQVISLEILDATQKHVLADAFWVQREDLPGGFFTSSGMELEQEFWVNPLNYTRISRGVGRFPTIAPRTKKVRRGKNNTVVMHSYTSSEGHQGVDFAAPTGTPIYAVANGRIVHYGQMSGYGNLVIIEHPGNYKTYYAHLSAFNRELEEGSEVRRGLEIGYVGTTGHSTGPHLHFELRKNNVYLNPLSSNLELDLWTLRSGDQDQLTQNIVLFSSFLN